MTPATTGDLAFCLLARRGKAEACSSVQGMLSISLSPKQVRLSTDTSLQHLNLTMFPQSQV
jgi:hypothetical protein